MSRTAPPLEHDARREKARMFALSLPALAVICVVVLAPILRVLWMSLLDAAGNPTLANYAVLFGQGANIAVIVTTLKISLIVTLACVLIGYPLSYFLAQISPRLAALLIFGIVLPYLTSILVRTYAWTVLLGRRGIINNMLVALGIVDEPLVLMFNATATILGMTHMMLPMLVLPLYGNMRAIDRSCLRAAASLGASPARAFWKVYFPLSLPGLAAGALLVFLISLGFFITPAVLGGGRVTLIAQQIATAMSTYSGFGVASALGIMLLVVTAGILLIVGRALRLDPGRIVT